MSQSCLLHPHPGTQQNSLCFFWCQGHIHVFRSLFKLFSSIWRNLKKRSLVSQPEFGPVYNELKRVDMILKWITLDFLLWMTQGCYTFYRSTLSFLAMRRELSRVRDDVMLMQSSKEFWPAKPASCINSLGHVRAVLIRCTQEIPMYLEAFCSAVRRETLWHLAFCLHDTGDKVHGELCWSCVGILSSDLFRFLSNGHCDLAWNKV